jgi:hypothetical protein
MKSDTLQDALYVTGALRFELAPDVLSDLSAHVHALLADPERKPYDDRLVGHVYGGEQVDATAALPDMLKAVLCLYGRQYVTRLHDLNKLKVPGEFDLSFKDSWVVRSRAGDYNPVHMHFGGLSGIVYVQVPPQVGEPQSQDGKLDFVFGQLNPRAMELLGPRTVTPRTGDLYIFPSWLQHVVYPFRGDGDRISYSFNLEITRMPAR